MLISKIVHLKKIYKFGFAHFFFFFEKRSVFIFIKKTLKRKIVHLKKIYHFLIKRTVFVLILKNVIKNQKFNFPEKLCEIRNKNFKK